VELYELVPRRSQYCRRSCSQCTLIHALFVLAKLCNICLSVWLLYTCIASHLTAVPAFAASGIAYRPFRISTAFSVGVSTAQPSMLLPEPARGHLQRDYPSCCQRCMAKRLQIVCIQRMRGSGFNDYQSQLEKNHENHIQWHTATTPCSRSDRRAGQPMSRKLHLACIASIQLGRGHLQRKSERQRENTEVRPWYRAAM
jgi:hypothetical protein